MRNICCVLYHQLPAAMFPRFIQKFQLLIFISDVWQRANFPSQVYLNMITLIGCLRNEVLVIQPQPRSLFNLPISIQSGRIAVLWISPNRCSWRTTSIRESHWDTPTHFWEALAFQLPPPGKQQRLLHFVTSTADNTSISTVRTRPPGRQSHRTSELGHMDQEL